MSDFKIGASGGRDGNDKNNTGHQIDVAFCAGFNLSFCIFLVSC